MLMESLSLPIEILEQETKEIELYVDNEDHPLIADIQAKFNQLNERFVAIKAIADTLKRQIEQEKILWNQELKETLQMERLFKEQQRKHNEMIMPNESEMKRKFQVFQDFLFFNHATENLEILTRKNNYQQWLKEVESECGLELDKIQKSLTALRPLREMASTWKNTIILVDNGAAGDKEGENETAKRLPPQVETKQCDIKNEGK